MISMTDRQRQINEVKSSCVRSSRGISLVPRAQPGDYRGLPRIGQGSNADQTGILSGSICKLVCYLFNLFLTVKLRLTLETTFLSCSVWNMRIKAEDVLYMNFAHIRHKANYVRASSTKI